MKNVNLKCSKCAEGIVLIKVRRSVRTTELTVKKCNSCKYQFGLKQALELKEITQSSESF